MASENLGQWGTLTLEMPDFLEDVREAVNSVAEFLLTILDIALAALQLIKAFALAFLDPITPIIQLIIDLVNGILRDLAQMGLYITHDYGMFAEGYPYRSLRQGYQGYERRMIARLTDTTDPTRPNISTATPVFGAFFYLSVDFTQIERLIKFIQKLIAMFTGEFAFSGNYPTPLISKVNYGADTTSVFGGFSNLGQFNLDGTPPDKAKVFWKVPNPARQDIYAPVAAFAGPSDFLVSVSTEPEGLHLMFDRPQQDSGSELTSSGSLQQRREQGPCLDDDGKPVVIYGGDEEIIGDLPAQNWNSAVGSDGTVKPGAFRYYGVFNPKDSAKGAIVPLTELNANPAGTGYFQRLFLVRASKFGPSWVQGEFNILLEYKDMPHRADIVKENGRIELKDAGKPASFYVRVASTTELVAENGGYKWQLAQRDFQTMLAGVPIKIAAAPSGSANTLRSPWSAPKKIRFPVGSTLQFLEAVKTALAILVLSRSDLSHIDEVEESVGEAKANAAREGKALIERTTLKRTGLEPYLGLVPQFWRADLEAVQDPVKFRKALLNAVSVFAKKLLDDGDPSPETMDFVVENSKNLRGPLLNYSDEIEGIGYSIPEQLKKVLGDATLVGHLSVPQNDVEVQQLLLDSTLEELAEVKKQMKTAQTEAEKSSLRYQLKILQDEKKEGKAQLKIAEKDDKSSQQKFGIAPNISSMGVINPVGLIVAGDLVTLRKPHFIEMQKFLPEVKAEISPDKANEEMLKAPPLLRALYEKNREENGSVKVDASLASSLNTDASEKFGSGDFTPVLFYNKDQLQKFANNPSLVTNSPLDTDAKYNDARVVFFRSFVGDSIYQQAALVLQMAAAHALRSPQDGEWIAIRFFDSIPGVEDFFKAIEQWLKALKAAFQSIIDAILAYINFIEARLVELQQLIRRINALLQSILGYMLDLPSCHFLPVLENGTAGIVRGLAAAQNKPNDSVRAHGAGAGLVLAVLPGIAGQFLQALLVGLLDGPDDGNVAVSQPADMFSPDAIPAEPAEGPDDEPDVL